ncbi:hypothetical protein H072_2714 [Dactylellina haptotyla CBS 200.50]|uniref:Mannose-6-phosphate isomerase n=1 Tax=Dactylellina haptotyla (strain CBS 200.50) TaxID=1284197 RepID=S8AK59_DACHA|nr:hypothetical protein H072_2714 [Dactylellina haptotyla CBS 200.50]
MSSPVHLYELSCGVNNYDWGKKGSASCAARFASGGLIIDETKPYAELWMGTHPSLPSRDVESGNSLQDLISQDEALLGDRVVRRFGPGRLPFLFKVLSIGKALSIQAHPDKLLAEELHSKDPKNYPDDNHKPEMAIAITPFTGLCGFRPLSEIKEFLSTVPSLRDLLGQIAISSFETLTASKEDEDQKRGLKMLYETLMKSDPSAIALSAEILVHAARTDPDNFIGGAKLPNSRSYADLIIELNDQFPSDIGLFSTFFLNFVSLEPGQGMFLQANEPHAYLSGDIIECMASSDNVVRAGFTPKFKDVDTLVSMLTYRSAPVSAQIMTPTPYNFKSPNSEIQPTCLLYNPPIEEFAVISTTLQAGTVEVAGIPGPSIIIFTKGMGRVKGGLEQKKAIDFNPGTVVFLGAGVDLEIEGSDVQCYRAFCNVV